MNRKAGSTKGAKSSLEAALEYHDQGRSLIPIEPRGKTPLVQWRPYQERLATEDEIRDWWTKWPDANIGLIAGEVSRIIVIDIDSGRVEDVDETARAILKEASTDMIVRTGGGGVHLFYKYPTSGLKVRNRVDAMSGVDIRGDGGYVVVPPSVHQSGKRYKWLRNGKPGKKLPDWAKVGRNKNSSPGAEHWVDEALRGVEQGRRNHTCASLTGHLAGKGLGLDEIMRRMLDWNLKNDPPMSDDEVRNTVKSIHKRDRDRAARSFGLIEFIFDDLPEESETELDPEPESKSEGVLRPITASELLATTDTNIDWVVKDILPAGCCGFVAADPRGYKTFLLIALGIAIAAKAPFAGRFDVPKPRRVLGIFAEDSREGLARRLLMLFEGMGLEEGDLADRFHFVIRPQFSLDSDEHMAELEQLIKHGEYDVVFIDPFAEVFTGSENDKGEVAAALSKVKAIRDRTGASVLIAHHLRKPSESDRGAATPARIRGSGYLVGWAEVVMLLNPNEGGIKVDVTLKEAAAPDPFVLTRVESGDSLAFVYADAAEEAKRQDDSLRRSIIDYVAANPGTSKRQIRDSVGRARARNARTLAALVNDGIIRMEKEGSAHRHYLVYDPYGAHGADRGETAAPLPWDETGAAGRSLLGSPTHRPGHPAGRNPFDVDHGPAPLVEIVEGGEVVGFEVTLGDQDVVAWYELFWPAMLERLRMGYRQSEGDELEHVLQQGRQAAYRDWLRTVLSN